MRIIQALCKKNECYIIGKKITPKGIVVHSTGCNNPNLSRYCDNISELGANKYNNHWNQYRPDNSQKCVHAFIGLDKNKEIATAQTLPWNMRCWGCGKGSKGTYNDTHIQFEICEDGLIDSTYFNKVYKEAVELCVYLCQVYKIDPDNIVCHKETYRAGYGSNHTDVEHWFPRFGKTMDDFREDVSKQLGNYDNKVVEKVETNTSYVCPFKVRVGITDLNIRTGAGTGYKKTGRYTGIGIFTISEVKQGAGSKKGWGKLKSGAGWISLDYCTLV